MGDNNTFEIAFEQHVDELFRYCSLRISDRERARDLTQETYLRAWEYLQKGEPVREYRPFLYQILRRLIIDEYRKKKSVSLDAMITDDTDSVIESHIPQSEHDEMEEAMDRFDGARTLEALQKLPELYKETLMYRYINSLTLEEIAKITNETENAVSVRIHRGLKKLRAILEEETKTI
ncbi:MAG: polymerase sigma factor, sigma-70 family [Candidatus Kaiserbacteria bacterium]|nr:polymerase sigma factor, sigma-70 family [Candidatus Kaiserbacteria bacterium]